MKSLFAALLLFCCFSFAPPPGWEPVPGETSGACTSVNALTSQGAISPTVSWPMNKVVRILREARPLFQGWNLGQMIQAYNNCGCVITYLGEGWFQVRLGGGVGIIAVEDI